MSSPQVTRTTPPTTTTNSNHHGSNAARSPASAEAPKSLRGLNKPKCSECGNVARSRCPFQACKSCCVKARNPCHIHVLKQNASYSDKSPSQSSPLFDQQRTGTSPNRFSPTGSSSRPYPTHAYFPGSQSQIRVKRPLSRKEIAAINTWRFTKLKEYSDSKIEAEDEAFGRYMQNVSLLENVFSVNAGPLEGLSTDGHGAFESGLSEQADSATEDDSDDMLVEGLKVRFKSNAKRTEKHKQRLRKLIDKGLQKLKGSEDEDKSVSEDDDNNSTGLLSGNREVKKPRTTGRERLRKISLVNALLEKLSKAHNQEDINACIEMYVQVFGKNICEAEVNIKNSGETDRSHSQEVTCDGIASEQEPATSNMVGEGSRLESSRLFGRQEMQFLCNPEIYLKGWMKVDISPEKIQKGNEDLLTMNDITEL